MLQTVDGRRQTATSSCQDARLQKEAPLATERIIEGTWTCSSCGAEKILARHAKCQGCGNPREGADKESQFDFGKQDDSGALQAQAVTDEKALTRAQAGVDWYCGFCKTANPGTGAKCQQCGAAKDAKEGEGKIQQLGAPGAPAPVQERPGVVLVNPGGGAAVKAMEERERAARAAAAPKRRAIGIGIASVLAVVGGLTWFGTRSKEVVAEQISAHWERTVHRETFTAKVASGWKDELHERAPVMPTGGKGEDPGVMNVRDCRREQRGTRKVPDGSRRVCEKKTHQVQCGTKKKCRVADLGNGFAKETCEDVPKYCSEPYDDCHDETIFRDEPIYGDKCDYDTFAWDRVESAKKEGAADAPVWPELHAQERDRLVREEQYAVEFSYRDGDEQKRFTSEPKTAADFERLRAKKTAKLSVSLFGGAALAEDVP